MPSDGRSAQDKGKDTGKNLRSSRSKTGKSTGSFTVPWADEHWTCKICSAITEDPDVKIMECRRCQGRYCSSCLNKGDNEYAALTSPDNLWFCAPCLVLVEKNLQTEKLVEQRCREILKEFEDRVKKIEEELNKKCDSTQVRNIVKEELAIVNQAIVPGGSSQQKPTADT